MRRRWHTLTCLATATHHLFELAAGTGLVFQPYLGLRGATALWSVTLPGWFLAAARGSPKWDRPLATSRGVPLLVEAEGLRQDQLPAYNAVLYAWALSAAAALLRETPRGARKWAMAGVFAAVPLRFSARHHFRWIKEQARTNPAWWNRAVD